MLRLRSPLLSSSIPSSSICRTPADRRRPPPSPRILFAKPARALVSAPREIRCCSSPQRSGAGAVVQEEEGSPAEEADVAEGSAEFADGAPAETAASASYSLGIGSPPFLLGVHRMSLGDQAFFLLAFIACTTSIAFTSLVIAAVPTLLAMRRAAISLARLADTAREELPSTMAAIRLSGMEISDLTLELSDLSQEIADGVSKSAQAVQAAEAGIRQIGALARRQTMSIIQERANLPSISLKPVVAGAAKKTSNVVGQAKRTLMNIISRGGNNSDGDSATDKVEI